MELKPVQFQILDDLVNTEPFENNPKSLVILNESKYPYPIDEELNSLIKENLIENVSWDKRILNHVSAVALEMQESEKILGYCITLKGNFEFQQHLKEVETKRTQLELDKQGVEAQVISAAEAKKATALSEKSIDLSKEANGISNESIIISKDANKISMRSNAISIFSAAFAAIALVISIVAIVIQSI